MVRNLANPQLFRHYTICNAMNPPVYDQYVSRLKQMGSLSKSIGASNIGESISFDKTHLGEGDTDSAMFTIKNYNSATGLSFRFTERQDAEFEVKGPMGKGLQMKPTGVHMAFAAGTGILCFMDLVAFIANTVMQTINSIDSSSDRLDQDHFRFILYVSFPSRQASVGLELCEALNTYCNRTGLITFELYTRLSQEKVNPARWDTQWIESEL